MQRIPSAWVVIRARTRLFEIPSEQKRTLEDENEKKKKPAKPLSQFTLRSAVVHNFFLTV
jgi:hypothetical protein